MDGSHRKRLGAWLAPGVVALALSPAMARGDDNGFFGRLFRLGGNSASAGAGAPKPNPARQNRTPAPVQPERFESAFGDTGSGGAFIPPANRSPRQAEPIPAGGPISSEGPSTPELGPGNLEPRVLPRSRVAPAVTSADPLLNRLALGKSNDGSQFGMFLQVFADGTVIDSEGVHRVAPSDIRPIAEAIQAGELSRLRGHCGTPSNDFIDYVHIVIYERRMGRLQATSFSYGGNPQGCEAGIRRIHAILETLQAKISRPPAPATASAAEPGRLPAAGLPPAAGTDSQGPSGTIIPLSPVSPP